ncbi:MAG: metallophosphoesterase [Oscillospiraceae bacterium]|jgi:hypothetical protein|nr:metallophosphoesterase [Oscillospiraceae bacterium]
MLYITGDTHGDLDRFESPEMRKVKKGDTLFIAGDFGFVWDDSAAFQAKLKKLAKKKYTIAFIDGTHENFSLLNAYPVEEWCGGKVHRIADNIVHLMRGQVFTVEEKKIFALGGGLSQDFDLRDIDDAQASLELPSKAELMEAAENLGEAAGVVDFILTHEPTGHVKAFLRLKDQNILSGDPTALGEYLEELAKVCKFKRWYFGSMHLDKVISSTHTAVYRKVLPVE